MDFLDVQILRVMGIRPFMRWPRRYHGVKPAQVARALGKNVQVVKDRIARMETDGVIRGYGVYPNLRSCGLRVTSYHLTVDDIPDEEKLSRLRAVDGVIGLLWFYGPHVCFDLSHANSAEQVRRLDLITQLAGGSSGVLWSHDHAFPEVPRRLTPLDWRIIEALLVNARRPLSEVAQELGVTAKTIRNRVERMRSEGSIDEYVIVDFSRMTGLLPFIMYVWFKEGGPDQTIRLLELLDDRRFNHFHAGGTRPGTFVMHLVADTPAQVQHLVRQALEVDGVERVEPQIPTGGFWNETWLSEVLARQAGAPVETVPKRMASPSKREMQS